MAVSRNYTDPVAQVIIKDYENGKEWHWGSPHWPFLTSASMVWEINGKIPVVSIGVDVPYEYAIPMLDIEGTPFKKDNYLKMRLGYGKGGFTPWVMGYLHEGGKGLSMTADGLSGNLECTILHVEVFSGTVPVNLWEVFGHDPVVFMRDICSLIGYDLDLSVLAERSFNMWKLLKNTKRSTKETKDFYAGLEGKSILGALDAVAAKLGIKYWVGYKGTTKSIFFYTDPELASGAAAGSYYENTYINKYVVRGIIDPRVNQFPCYEFTPTDDALGWLDRTPGASAKGVNAAAIDTDSGEDVGKDVKPTDDKEPKEGKDEHTEPVDKKVTTDQDGTMVADIKKAFGQLGTYMSAPVRTGGADMFYEQAAQFQRQGNPGLQMTIKSIGVPEERVGNLCRLWGAGAIFNGTYYIQKLTHSWSPGSWDMELEVLRRGMKAVSGEQKESAGGQMPQ